MKICIKCFANAGIIRDIVEINDINDCSYCGSEGLPVLDIKSKSNEDFIFKLKIEFSFLNKSESGFPLHRFFTKQINFFNPNLPEDKLNNIIYDLFGKQTEFNYTSNFYRPKNFSDTTSTYVIEWEKFKYNIKYANRFGFNISKPLKKAITTILEKNKTVIESGLSFSRARIGSEDELTPYTDKEMGAPPREYASEGRANPRGIPYLYLAKHMKTALTEVRPEVANTVSIGEFTTNRNLNIVRLQNQTFFETESYIEQIRLYLLNYVLHEEFAEPIATDTKYFEYIPTQFVAELAKSLGIDGFEYKSTLTTGTNYCFFHPDDLSYIKGSGKLLKVTSNNVSYDDISFGNDLWDL